MQPRGREAWGVLIGAIVLLFAGVLFGQSQASPQGGAPSGSSYNQGKAGLSAIFSALDAEGFARRWELPPERLSHEVDRLVLWNPANVPAGDWSQILRWVRSGHVLIVAGPSPYITGSLHMSAPPRPQDAVPALATRPEGTGWVLWSPDPGWLTNEQILEQGNLQQAIRLLTPWADGVVAFDEYHHGFRLAERWWQILRGNLRVVALQLAAALMLLYWAAGTRFGSPRPLPEESPRAAVEYVYSMAQLYRRSRAAGLAAASLYRGLARELGRAIGGARGLSHEELARRSAQAAGATPTDLALLLDRLGSGSQAPLQDQELIALAAQAEAIQRRVRNAGNRDERSGRAAPK